MLMKLRKEEIRSLIKETIAAKTKDAKAGLELYRQLSCLEAFTKASLVLSYASMNDEISTDEIRAGLMDSTKTLALPRISNDGMDFYILRKDTPLEDQLETGSYSIREPKQNLIKLSHTDITPSCIVLVPGRAFTTEGKRLGRGKGFYDKYFHSFFSSLQYAKPYFAGICYECQILTDLPCEDHDITVDCIVTENRIIMCK